MKVAWDYQTCVIACRTLKATYSCPLEMLGFSRIVIAHSELDSNNSICQECRLNCQFKRRYRRIARMEFRRKIPLVGLSPRFTTRRRGEEAFQKLLPELQGAAIILDLDGTSALSASYLDGLLLKLMHGGYLENVVFQTTNPLTRSKLERLSGIRSADIRLMNSIGRARKARKRTPYRVRPIHSRKKDLRVSTASEIPHTIHDK